MLSGTIAFILGVLSLYELPRLPPGGLFLLLGLFAVVWLRYPLQRRVRWLPLCFVLGFSWAGNDAAQRLYPSLSPDTEAVPLQVVGRVDSLPQFDGHVLRFILQVEQGRLLNGRTVTLPERLRLSWYSSEPRKLVPGQRWHLRVKLKRPWAMRNPGGFDYERWLFREGIRATGYIRSAGDNHLLADDAESYRLMRLRYTIRARLQHILDDTPMRGVITALAIGERGAITDEQWEVLLRTGTNHLMAISGLHVGLVSGLLFWLGGWLWRLCPRCCLWMPAPRAAALVAMMGAIGYAGLAGFSIPTQRAVIMLMLVLGAVWRQRAIQPARVVIPALWIVVLYDPVSVLSAGFWLSFSAVALILYGMRGRVKTRGLYWRWGRVQVVVALGLLPLLLLFFQQGSLISPLANLVAVPLVSLLVVPLTLSGVVLLSIAPGGADGLLQLAALLMHWLWPLLAWLSEAVPVLPIAAGGWTVFPALVGVLWLLAPRGWPMRSAAIMLFLPLLTVGTKAPSHGMARFTLLDVGQGLAAVVQTHNHTLVFDTGPRYPSGFNTGDAVLVPFLRNQGIHHIDTLIVSHRGNDHAGGVSALLERIPATRVLSSVHDRNSWFQHKPCRRGQTWRWDGVVFRILNPEEVKSPLNQNERSCVLKVTAGEDSLLLTADIEAGAERGLLQSGEDLSADILQVPHHGSNTSSTQAFVTAVQPQVVLYAVGYRNRYGFPHRDVVKRYRRAGARMYRNDRTGALQFELGAGLGKPHAWRTEHRKIWHM